MPFTHHPPKTITKILLHFHCSVAKLCPTLQLYRLHFHIPSFNDTAKTCHFIPTHLKTHFPTEPQCFITATKRNNDSSSTCPNFPNFLHVFFTVSLFDSSAISSQLEQLCHLFFFPTTAPVLEENDVMTWVTCVLHKFEERSMVTVSVVYLGGLEIGEIQTEGINSTRLYQTDDRCPGLASLLSY